MLVFRLVHLFFFWSNHHGVLSKSMLTSLCELDWYTFELPG